MPPLGWDAEHPKPELDWRRKKETIGALHDEGAPLPPCFEFLKPRQNITPFPPSKPPPKPPQPDPPKPAATSAARTRRWYARRNLGKAVYALELDELRVERLCVNAGLLQPLEVDDHAKVKCALERLIDMLDDD